MPERSRILFLARPCANRGMIQQLAARTDAYFCRETPRHPVLANMQLFTWRKAWELRRALREGRYDLVISCSNPDALWRAGKNPFNNLGRVLHKLTGPPGGLAFDLLPWMLGDSQVPLAIYDWDDNTIVPRRNWPLLRRATCYFKTQSPRNPYKAFLFQDARNDDLFNIVRQPVYQDWVKKLRPFSIGVTVPENGQMPAAVEKKTDIFFAGAAHYSTVRAEGLKQLEELRQEGFNIDLHVTGPDIQSIPQDEFLRRCAEAWLVWSPEGAGWDCMRHYWAPLMGSVPLLIHPDTRRHEPLLDGVHAFYYGVEGDDLKRVARLALSDKQRLRRMAREAEEFVRPRHTHAALAEYLINETMKMAKET